MASPPEVNASSLRSHLPGQRVVPIGRNTEDGSPGEIPLTNGKIDVNASVSASVDTTGLATDTGQATTNAALGETTGAAVVTDANGTIQQYARGLVKLLAAWIGTLGQKNMAGSAPVVIASDQSAISTLADPPAHVAAITPSDGSDLSNATRAIYVGVSGDIVLITVNSETVTFKSVPVGILPVRAARVKATSTTATNMLALW